MLAGHAQRPSPEGEVVCSPSLELSAAFPHHLSAKCDFPRELPRVHRETRGEHASKLKAVGGGAMGRLGMMHVCIRYAATPGRKRDRKLTGSGKDQVGQSLPTATDWRTCF